MRAGKLLPGTTLVNPCYMYGNPVVHYVGYVYGKTPQGDVQVMFLDPWRGETFATFAPSEVFSIFA